MALGFGSDFRFDIFARDRTGPAWRGVETSMQRTQRAASGLLRTLGPLMGVGVGAVSATMFADMARRSLEFSDALVAAADRTSFAVDELERLRFAGYQNRVELGQTDMAMQRFSRRLAEAANGSGELRADLQRLGIPLHDTAGNMRSSYDVLLDYADAVAGAQSEQEQLRLAFKAFDSEGAALVNVLRHGREGLEAYGRAAEEAGAVMGDELARNASEANRRLREIQQSFQGQFNTAIAENADELVALADALGQVAAAAIRVAAIFGSLFQDPIADTLAAAVQQASLAPIDEEIERLRAEIEAASRTQSRGAIGRIQEYQRQIRELIQERERLEALFERGETPDGGSGSTGRTGSPTPAPAAEWPNVPTPRYAPRYDYQARRREEFDDWLDEIQEVVDEFASEQAEAYKDALLDRREEFSRAFGSIFADGVMAAFDGDLEDFLRERLRQAAYEGLYDAFTQAGEVLFDILRNRQGGGEGGGWLSTVANALSWGGGKSSGPKFGGGKAAGGPTVPGLVYRFGEKGPEDAIIGAPAHVLTNDQTMGRGTTIVEQRFHLHAEGAVMTDQLLTQMEDRANTAAGRAVAPVMAAAGKQAKRSTYRLGKR